MRIMQVLHALMRVSMLSPDSFCSTENPDDLPSQNLKW